MNTAALISSVEVDGTEVYNRDGTRIGAIDHLMIDKQSGKVAYAVIGFGGFLGMGEDHHPIPWAKLHYDTARNRYLADITEQEVKAAPLRKENWRVDRDWELRMHQHYRAPNYWV